MSKAILVMDMPSSCDECDINGIFCGDVGDNDMCRAAGCPLKEVPQKKEDKSLKVVPTVSSQYTEYAKGYNACIDEIIGGAE